MTYEHLPVSEDTHEDVMLFKFQSKARNVDSIIKRAMILLREKTKLRRNVNK